MRSSTSLHRLGTSVVVLLAAVTVACGSAAPDHAQVVAQTTPTTYFPQFGTDTHAYRPHRLNPSVDGSLYVTGMHWRTWTSTRAVGHGLAHLNDCRPDCADGHYTTHPVVVRLTQPRKLCGSRFFTGIRLDGPGYHDYARRPGVACR